MQYIIVSAGYRHFNDVSCNTRNIWIKHQYTLPFKNLRIDTFKVLNIEIVVILFKLISIFKINARIT